MVPDASGRDGYRNRIHAFQHFVEMPADRVRAIAGQQSQLVHVAHNQSAPSGRKHILLLQQLDDPADIAAAERQGTALRLFERGRLSLACFDFLVR
jgi:hypothetical protein